MSIIANDAGRSPENEAACAITAAPGRLACRPTHASRGRRKINPVAPGDATGSLKTVFVSNVDDPENNGSALRLQAGLLARRFGMPDAIAATVAALAFERLAR